MTGQGHPIGNIYVLTPLQGRLPWLIFCRKFCIILRYNYETPIFLLGRIRFNGIISTPYPEVSLDNFGFPVDGRILAISIVRLFVPELRPFS